MNQHEQEIIEKLKVNSSVFQTYIDLHKHTGNQSLLLKYYWKHVAPRLKESTWRQHIQSLVSLELVRRKKYGRASILIKNEITPEFYDAIIAAARQIDIPIKSVDDRWNIKTEATR